MMKSRAACALFRFGAKPPSSPTLVLWPASLRPFFSVWKISEPQRTASRSVGAPTGMIMNSWKSIGLSAWTPPLMMFIIGTGRQLRIGAADIAVERQAGGLGSGLGDSERDAENGIGAEPALVRACRRARSWSGRSWIWFSASMPPIASKISPLTASTARSTPLPRKRGAAVAQLDGLVGAGRGSRRHGCAAHRTVFEHDIDFDGRIAAAVEDLTADDVDDGGHGGLPRAQAVE